MSSAFFGLDLALRALQAQQAGVNVANHNVANANTEGFSRQAVEIVTTTPYSMPGMNRAVGAGQVGTGAIAGSISRARDIFLDGQYRTEVGDQRNAEVKRDALEEIEIAFGEPSDNGLSGLFNKYFAAWQELVDEPGDGAARESVLQQSVALTEGFKRTSDQLASIGTSLNDQVATYTTEVNSLTAQLATLNQQVVQVEATGQRANDLRDRRDLALDRLAELAQITVVENADGSVNVSLGGDSLVAGGSAETLAAVPQAAAPYNGNLEVQFSSGPLTGTAATLGNARLAGLVETRDVKLPTYKADLDAIANDLIVAVNTLHRTGYGQDGVTNRDFFSGTDAATIAVAVSAQQVAAASAPGEAGNSATALQIAQLRTSPTGPRSEQAYGALVSRLGAESQAARGLAENQESLVTLISRRRESLSGVSLDEEAVNLMRYQRAYEAAARLITATDQMLDKLINGTGIVGR